MDARRVGNAIRMLRVRARWTQAELARRARVSPATVSRMERGAADALTMDAVHRVGLALDAWIDFSLRWRGGDLDQALGARHGEMHEALARWMHSLVGWFVVPEVSFSVYGERGVIDALAWHPSTSTLLVVELKTELIDISEVLGTFDRKLRLAPQVALDRGWRAAHVAGWVLIAEGRTNHRRLGEHAAVVRARLPDDGRRVRGWLAAPRGPLMALSFLPTERHARLRTSLAATKRVRGRPRAASPPSKPATSSGTTSMAGTSRPETS